MKTRRERGVSTPRKLRTQEVWAFRPGILQHKTGEDLYCRWKANIVAIATRHADAVDVRFELNNHPMWIAMPCTAWVEQKKRSGKVITDQLAVQIAGRYLKQIIEEGYDARRELYTMSVPEVLEHLDAVVTEAKAQGSIPALPVGIGLISS
jgi:hypothetical protein